MITEFLSGGDSWTLFSEDDADVIEFNSMLSMDFSAENQTAAEPVEQGSFASYNKIASPSQLRVTLASAADPAGQQALLDSLADLCAGTKLLTLASPAQEYAGYTLESFTYSRRADGGAQLLTAELTLKEVRQVETQAYTSVSGKKGISAGNAKKPGDAGTANVGRVQAKDAGAAKSAGSSMLYELTH
jgi:hypothetical protein